MESGSPFADESASVASPVTSPTKGRKRKEQVDAPTRASNRFVQWTDDEVDQMVLDEKRTEQKMQQLEAAKVAKDKLLTGKSASFVKQFKEKMNAQSSEDPRVFRSEVDLFAEDISQALKERKRLSVVVYGHDSCKEVAAAAKIVQGVVSSLRPAINVAARQHEMKLENDKKADERKKVAIADATARRATLDEVVDRLSMNSSAVPSSVRRGSLANHRPSLPSGAGKGRRESRVRIHDDGSPGHNRGKRLSLVARQTITQDREYMKEVLPAPQLEKLDLDSLRRASLPEPSPETEDLPARPSPLATPLKGSSRRSLVSRPSLGQTSLLGKKRASGMTALKGNGKRGIVSCVHFNGANTYVKLPPLTGLSEWIGSCEIDFWVKTDQKDKPMTLLWIGDHSTAVATLTITMNENHKQEETSGVTCFYVRDQCSNVFCATTHEDFATGYWRHVHFEIKSLEENQVNLFVDGRPCRMSIKASEGPNVFAGWDQYGMLCAEGHGLYGTQPGQKISKHFYGALIDMRIASFAPDATLRCHWDLLENQEEINPKDVTQTDTPIHHHAVVPESCSLQNGEAIHPDWKLENFPSTCLWFGGHDHINVGPLGAFGELLGVSTRVEFWMRSGCQDRSMSVMRVTDTPMKHAEFGIDLNKNAAGEYQKGSALFTLIDASGTPFVACQSSHDLCDSKWHEVVWEIFQHSRMVVKIDGFTVGLDFHSTELATATPTFIPLTQWLCIGGHNNRGTVQDHFEGFLRNIKISGANPEDPDSGTPMQLACWPLDDGPGCTVSMDKTGNGNNGIIYHRGSKKKWATWLDVPQPDELASLDGLASMAELASFDNNSVELSCVAVTQETNAKGLYQEKVVNLIDGRMEVRLETSCIDIYKKFGAPKPDPSDPFSSGLTGREVPLKVIPAGHGMNISSHENLVQLLSTSIENGKSADHRHSSVLYSLRLGDGQLDVFDLKGFYPRTRSVWDPTTDQWVEPLMLMSQDDKHVMFANQRARQTEEALQRFGRSPALFLNARQSLDGCHFDDTIAGSLLATSFVANPGSGLAFVCLRPRTSTANEDVAAEHFLHAQDDATRRCAAIVLQKAARGWNAKKTRAVRELARDDMLRKREHRRHLRESMPEEVSIRDSRVCLIVNAARSLDPRIPDLPDVQKRCEALVPVLQRQGWTVTVLEGADATPPGVRQALSSLKERVRAKDCVAMVHYMGYAAVGAAFHTWPTAAEIAALLDGNEAVARAAVAHSEEEARLELTAEEQAAKDAAATEEAQRVKHEAAANAEAEKKKRKSKGGGDWVRSTANAQQKEDEEKQRLEAEQSARAPSAEEAALAKAAKTPLPFEPSPTPDVSHIPPTPVYAGADHQYLVLPTTPLEYSPDNTLPLSELQCPELFDPVVGFQCVVSAELHPPPGTDAPAACFLQATSGERASWEGAAAPQFFGHYVFKGLHGGYAAVNVSKLLKSAARVRREAAMVAEHAKTVAAAEEGEDVPPEDLVVPVSERGVSWEAYRDYVHSRMAKRPVRLSGRTFAQGGEQQYVGDIVLAEYLNSFDRRAVSRAASGGVLTVTTDEECVDAKSLLNVRDASMEVVNAVYGGTVRPRPPTPGIHPPQMLLSFDQPVSCALPPYAQEEDWRGYLRSLVAASSAPAADAMRFALRPTTGLTFDLVVSCPDDAAAFDSFVADVALSYRGRMGSLEFRPHALPSDVVMAPTAFKRVSSFPMEGAHKTIQRVKKAYLSGALDMLLQSSGVGASVAGFAPASQAELATMRAAHDEEMRKKKADAAHRAENPTNEMDKLKKSVRDKRRSLASGMF